MLIHIILHFEDDFYEFRIHVIYSHLRIYIICIICIFYYNLLNNVFVSIGMRMHKYNCIIIIHILNK